MTIEEQLKSLILSRYKSLRAFTQAADIPYTTVDSMLKRGVKGAGVSSVIKVCNHLGIDIDALGNGRIEEKQKFHSAALTPPELQHIKKYRTLDGHGKETVDVVLDKEVQRMEEMRKAEEKKVLKPKEAQEPEDKVVIPFMRNRASAGGGVSLEDDDYVPIVLDRTYETSKADYAVRVTGSSMEPKYFDGDILLIRKQPSVDVGQIGIFTINDEGYVKKQGADRLISVNPDYDDIYPSPDDDVRCCGLVLGKL